MTWITRLFIVTGALTLFVFLFGFVLFAADVMRPAREVTLRADAIVVLTGGQLRVEAGLDLLEKGRARRLLITGVNRRAGKMDIARAAGVRAQKLECCVDLGYEALNTRGNANETSAWVARHRFRSLIVVTASYHMPRSLIELSVEMPDVDLIAHSVVPQGFQNAEWWLDPQMARLLFVEYLKVFPAAARLAASRTFPGHVAESAPRSAANAPPAPRR